MGIGTGTGYGAGCPPPPAIMMVPDFLVSPPSAFENRNARRVMNPNVK